jgi:hypothetical protein
MWGAIAQIPLRGPSPFFLPIAFTPVCNDMLLAEAAFESRQIHRSTSLSAWRSRAHILHRPGGGMTEFPRSPKRPVRITQHLAGEQHDVGLPGTDNMVPPEPAR